MYLAFDEECWKLTQNTATEVQELNCNHEEADTRLLLHTKAASREVTGAVVIVSEDTDVFIIALSHVNEEFTIPVYLKRGTLARTRYVNITEIINTLGSKLCSSLPGLHTFTGCDTVSAFAGKGKLTAFKKIQKSDKYQETFKLLGSSLQVSDELYKQLEIFLCDWYGSKKVTDINELRYLMFCAKKGKIESHQLPPCFHCFVKHTQRANYQAYIWRNCLLHMQQIPNPEDNGWKLENGNLVVDWMSEPPAPEAVLEFLSCNCSRSCKVETCVCITNGLKCTDMCRLKDCENSYDELNDEGLESDDKTTDNEYSDETDSD